MNKNEFIYITKESDSIYKITGTKTMKKYLKDYDLSNSFYTLLVNWLDANDVEIID